MSSFNDVVNALECKSFIDGNWYKNKDILEGLRLLKIKRQVTKRGSSN